MSTKINLGKEIHDFESGGVTENIPLKNFKYNLLISGGARNERTASLSHILNQFYADFPDIGVLLIQLGSNKDTYLYHLDRVYEYGDPDLNIPYSTGQQFNMLIRERFMRYLNAIFGFHYEMKFVIANLSRHYKTGGLPSSIVDFLEDLKMFLIKHPYSEEFTESNVRSIEKVVEIFQENPILERTLWIPLEVPEWLNLWSKGGKICINLSECSIYQQKLLVFLIAQSINNYIDSNNSPSPTGIVVIEDAENVLKRPPHDEYSKNYKINREYYQKITEEAYILTKEQIKEVFGDDNYLMNVQLEQVCNDLIQDDFRYRNISLITVCEDPSKVYSSISSHSQIKLQVG